MEQAARETVSREALAALERFEFLESHVRGCPLPLDCCADCQAWKVMVGVMLEVWRC